MVSIMIWVFFWGNERSDLYKLNKDFVMDLRPLGVRGPRDLGRNRWSGALLLAPALNYHALPKTDAHTR